MIDISLLHISRERPKQAFDVYNEWMNNCAIRRRVEYILAIDDNDPKLQEYRDMFKDVQPAYIPKFSVTDSRSGVAALNNAAKIIHSNTKILFSVQDDQGCFPEWDTQLLETIKDIDPHTVPLFLWVNDGLNAVHGLAPYYCATLAYYQQFGHVLYREYDGVYADNDMTEVAKRVGIKDVRYLVFQHRHWSIGLSKKDEISKKNDAAVNREGARRNQMIFEARSRRNFDL